LALLPGYAGYLLGHLALWPLLAAKGVRQARRRDPAEVPDVIRTRLLGGTVPSLREPPGRWVLLLAQDLGETRAALLAAEQLAQMPDAPPVALLVALKRSFDFAASGASAPLGYAPFNNPLSVLAMLARWRPRAVLIAGYNPSHHLTFLTRLFGVSCVLFNGSFAGESGGKRGDWRRTAMGAYAVPTDADRHALTAQGVDPGRVVVTGPLLGMPRRSDESRRAAEAKWRPLVNAAPGAPVVVAGSTHPTDEAVLLDAFARLRARFPGAVLILAPRFLGRTGGVESVLRETGTPFVRRSAVERRPPDVPVLLLDTTGELPDVYAAATLAHVGGSFDPARGGHTPVEALAWGVPMTVGPHHANQRAVVQELARAGVLAVCRDAAEVAAFWERHAADPALAADVRARSAAVIARQGTAIRNLYETLIGSRL
jgi:3-deoxy-D-manno-octulosonic-acid transferase